MKIRILYILIFLVIIGCSKDDEVIDVNTPPLGENTISGKVELPSNSTLPINTMSIVSVVDVADVSGDNYQIEIIPNEFTTQMVIDATGDVFLLGFNYPGQQDFTINSKSTALAMLMNLAPSLLMEPKGKKELINKILNHPNIESLAAKIDDLLSQNISPLNILDNALAKEVANFYEEIFSVQNKNESKIGEDKSYPVDVYQSGREIKFVNPGKSYETVIGVYKDDQKIQTLKVPRVNFSPTGIGDVIGAVASANAGEIPTGLQPVEEIYTIQDNGEYEFRIRNGFYANGIDSENFQALIGNLINWNLDFLLQILPTEGMGDCVQSLIADMLEFAQTSITLVESNPSAGEVLGLIYNFLSEFLAQSPVVSSCFANEVVDTTFTSGLKKLLDFTKMVGVLGNVGNLVWGIGQWVYDDGAFEKCYIAQGTTVSNCEEELDIYVVGTSLEEGSNKRSALFWKNQSESTLATGEYAEASAIYVENNDVFVAGLSELYTPTVWKNGIPNILTDDPKANTFISDIFVSGNDVYLAGNYIDDNGIGYGATWKNGVPTNLIRMVNSANINAIKISGSDVYAVGEKFVDPDNTESDITGKYFKNGELQTLEGGANNTPLFDIAINNNDVYILGNDYDDKGIKIWKNGFLQYTLEGINPGGNALFVSGEDVYVCGRTTTENNSNSFATIWKNGEVVIKIDENLSSSAQDLFVIGEDVYFVGTQLNNNNVNVTKLWKNDELYRELSDGTKHTYARGIFIKNNN